MLHSRSTRYTLLFPRNCGQQAENWVQDTHSYFQGIVANKLKLGVHGQTVVTAFACCAPFTKIHTLKDYNLRIDLLGFGELGALVRRSSKGEISTARALAVSDLHTFILELQELLDQYLLA
jgi:hypothetical protein